MAMASSKPYPLADENITDILDFPYLKDKDTISYLNGHGRIFFIIRGPPGSGKTVLRTMLQDCYKDAKTAWTDSVFISPCGPEWNEGNLSSSHEACFTKHTELMEKGTPVIINRNSNANGREFGRYMSLAAKYGYTVIVSETTEKFSTNPKVLALTNSKSLDEEYFRGRMKNWEFHVYPLYFGWFISPADTECLQEECRGILKGLEEVGLTYIGNFMSLSYPVFAVSEHCDYGQQIVTKQYTESPMVKDSLGCCHNLTVFGFAIVEQAVIALVSVKGHEKLLGEKLFSKNHDRDDDLNSLMGRLQISGRRTLFPFSLQMCEANISDMKTNSSPTLIKSTSSHYQIPDNNSITFILLGTVNKSVEGLIKKPVGNLWEKVCDMFSVNKHEIKSKGIELKAVKTYTHEDSLLILLKDHISVKSVFTGFYQDYVFRRDIQCRYWKKGECKWGERCSNSHSGRPE